MKQNKSQPWGRDAYKRFGLYFEGASPSDRAAKIGWAVLAVEPTVSGRGEMLSEDPLATALAKAQQAMKDGASGVDLYRYRDEAAYRNSRDAWEGGTLAEHTRRVEMLAAALRELEIPVNIMIVEK